jgi:hypothetical protein
MANCAYCNSFILFGGVTDPTGRYCNNKCQLAGNLLQLSHTIPDATLRSLLQETHQGPCPRCHGAGPVDVHKAHQVWSALIITSWSSKPELCCKSCAVRRQLGAIGFSAVAGWWGIPWGLILTPMQIIRNVVEICGGPSPDEPSALLKKHVRIQAAAHAVQRGELGRSSAPPVISRASTPPPIPGDDSRYQPK